jgi:hypothetical protein
MQHSILESPSGKRSAPSDAAGYVLRLTDANKHEREQPPRIISGDADLFVRMAELIPKPPRYLSTAVSDETPPETPKVRYVCDMIMAHYLGGLPRHDVAALIVLHGKMESWDAHLMLALAIKGSSKKLRPYRYTADYLRFARLVCLINRMNGWEDPLDPKNFRPAHFGEWWRPKPDPIKDLDQTILAAFKAQTIETRRDLVSLIKSRGFSATVTDRAVSVTCAGKIWNLKGYAATAHADSAEKFAAYRKRTAQPFVETQQKPDQVAAEVRGAYLWTLAENGRYHGIRTELAADGLIVPDHAFYEEHYEEHQAPPNTENPYNEKLAGAEHPRRAGADETIRIRVAGSTEPAVRTRPRDSTQQPAAEREFETANGPGIQPQGDGGPTHRRGGQVRSVDAGIAELRTNLEAIRRGIEEWLRLIRRLLSLPRWYRRHRSKQMSRAREFYRQNPSLRLRLAPGYLTRLLRQPLPEEPSIIAPRPTKTKTLYEYPEVT